MEPNIVGLILQTNTQEQALLLVFFPYKKISEVPLVQIQSELISIFKSYGIPKKIKVDNGRPFGDPRLELVPPLALLLIAFGIKVIWNRPATPQDNAKVERSQGVMGRWTEYHKCKSTVELQLRLWKEAEFYNFYFPIRRKNNKTRIQLFPDLIHTKKNWNPADFKLKRPLIFLAKGNWERKVSKNGQILIYNQRFSVGRKYKRQIVSIKLNPKKNQWNIFDSAGQLIKYHPSPFTKNSIWNLDLK